MFWLSIILLLFSCCLSAEMTLEEKVGQVMMVHFYGEEANDEARHLIQKLHIGNIILYNWSNGLHSPEQVARLSRGLQQLAKEIPLIIATDQEGGIVTRLHEGFTVFPGNKALAMTGEPELAERCAFAMGQEMRAVGINMNLAPVVDINSNPRNPIIGLRSFGDNPQEVIAFAGKALQGYQEAGVITSLKHFPGHGDVEVDSHECLPVLGKSKEQLYACELQPFIQLMSQAPSITTAHILVPALDGQKCITLSKSALDFLRGELGYRGVIISDSLVMEGVLKQVDSIEEAAIQAFNAGCDLLMLGGKLLNGSRQELKASDFERIHRALVDAVKTGRIPQERLDQSVSRILELKRRIQHPIQGASGMGCWTAHQELARTIAEKALRARKQADIDLSKALVLAPAFAADTINKNGIEALFFKELNPTEEEKKAFLEAAKMHESIIVFTCNAWKNTEQAALINDLLALNKRVGLVCLRDPLDAELFPRAQFILMTYSPVPCSIDAACQYLKDRGH